MRASAAEKRVARRRKKRKFAKINYKLRDNEKDKRRAYYSRITTLQNLSTLIALFVMRPNSCGGRVNWVIFRTFNNPRWFGFIDVFFFSFSFHLTEKFLERLERLRFFVCSNVETRNALIFVFLFFLSISETWIYGQCFHRLSTLSKITVFIKKILNRSFVFCMAIRLGEFFKVSYKVVLLRGYRHKLRKENISTFVWFLYAQR